MMFSTKTNAARLLMGVVIVLIALKVCVSWFTGSMSILAQATDSLLDLFAGIITFSAIKIASKPADENHPYGHGKVEDIAGLAQGILIFIAGGLIIYTSIRRIIEGTTIELIGSGVVVMLVSIVVSIFLSRHLSKVAKSTRSIALEANARNIAADIYSASAVVVGLLIVQLTGLNIVDSIIAIGVAIYLFKIGYETMSKPIAGLVDMKLPEPQELTVKDCLSRHRKEVVDFHSVRTRRAGSQCYIELHLVMARDINLERAHQICDQIEAEIKSTISDCIITIHVEPCNDECKECSAFCSNRRSK